MMNGKRAKSEEDIDEDVEEKATSFKKIDFVTIICPSASPMPGPSKYLPQFSVARCHPTPPPTNG